MLLTLVYFASSFLLSKAFDMLGIKGIAATAADTVLKILIGAAAIFVSVRMFSFKPAKPSVRRFLSGVFVCGAFAWAYIALNCYASSGTVDTAYAPMQTVYIVAVYAVYCLAVGFVEEALNRCLVLGSLTSVTAKDTALVISAVVFSASHCINFITSPGKVYSTFAQLIYAFIAGMFFGAVYLRTRSLGAVTVLHAAFNFVSLIWIPFSSESAELQVGDIAAVDILAYVRLYLPLLLAALFLIRPSKAKAIDELWKNPDTAERILSEDEENKTE